MNQLPKKITPCPIVEAIFEMHFDSELPEDAIFGVIYNEFRDEYKKVEQMPILQLPQIVRTQDRNLTYVPHYRISNGDIIIQVGPKVFSLVNVGKYIGWAAFSNLIRETYDKVKRTSVILNVTRTTLRYINIFDKVNILESANFKASLGKERLKQEKINFTAEILSDKSISQLKIINSAEVVMSGKKIKGSMIDIESSVDLEDFDSFPSAINYSHTEEKKLFYKVLGNQFVEQLNPEY